MNVTTLRYLITILALVGIGVHILLPSLAIDGVTLTLLVVSIIPWLAPLFKSLELPGGWKIEFQDLQKAEAKASDAGLLYTEARDLDEDQFSFQTVANTDPNLALAGLRIEIEKRLVKLAESRDLKVGRSGLGKLLRDLNGRQLINGKERAVLSDLSSMLNSAVHGAEVDQRAAEWAMDIGPQILAALDKRISSEHINYEGIT